MVKRQTPPSRKPKTSDNSKASALVVLGMHRSGTSALSGVLSKLGCDMPITQMPQSPTNEKGYFESKPFSDLLDDVLKSADSSWRDWCPFNPDWMQLQIAEPFIEAAVDLLKSEFAKSKFLVIKNPRLCRLMPLCIEVLDRSNITPFYALTHRNPIEVTASLVARDGANPTLVQLLWLRHVLDAEFATRYRPRYFTSYAALLDDWGTEMAQLQTVSGVDFPREFAQASPEIDAFLTPKLRHHDVSSEIPVANLNISEWTRDVFEILERWVGGSGNKKDFGALDEIRHQFDAMALNFDAVVQDGVNLPKVKTESASALSAAQSKLTKVEDALEKSQIALKKQVIEGAARVEALEKAHAAKLNQTSAQRDAAQEKYQTEIEKSAQLKKQLATTQSDLQQRSLQVEQTRSLLASVRAELDQQSTETATRIKRLEEDFDLRLDRMTIEKADLHQKLQVRIDELAKMDAAMEQKDAEFHELKVKIQVAEITLLTMASSTSWRITAPLRMFITKLRTIGKRTDD